MKKETCVILVDENDHPIGEAEKIEAHQKALCHRAFSIFIFSQTNDQLDLLIQQRHPEKYHCGGLWTNSCCSHPRPGESTDAAAHRRLQEELNLTIALQHVGAFHYIAPFDNGLTENEYDHVYVGFTNNRHVNPNPDEIAAVKWEDVITLKKDMQKHPDRYTPWFAESLEIALAGILPGA